MTEQSNEPQAGILELLRWRRGGYRIMEQPEGDWGARWGKLPRLEVSFFQEPPPPPWVWETNVARSQPAGVYGPAFPRPFGLPEGLTVGIYRLAWPEGGILVPADATGGDSYSPAEHASEILVHGQRAAAASDPKALLRFVNQWGLLGVGASGAETFPADSVALTGEWLNRLTQWIETLHALESGNPPHATWEDFARTLNEHLQAIHPIAIPSARGGLRPGHRAHRLLDILLFELWEQATEGKHHRQCPECRALFIPSRSNQQYCARLCANRPTVRKWKKKDKEKHKQKHEMITKSRQKEV